ncbi:MAG: ABC transporter permease, partial [Verrucomicrobiales bacterium]
VYNSALVALSERSRELATLRVIGFTKGEVSAILLGELAILTVVAIFLGWLIGFGLTWLIVYSLPTEHVRVPLVLSAGTYAFAAIVIVISALSSGLIVRRGVDQLSLVSVLKSRE